MLKRATYAWTPEDEAKLMQMAGQGLHLRKIALCLKRSESSIKKRARELRVRVPNTPRGNFRFDRNVG